MQHVLVSAVRLPGAHRHLVPLLQLHHAEEGHLVRHPGRAGVVDVPGGLLAVQVQLEVAVAGLGEALRAEVEQVGSGDRGLEGRAGQEEAVADVERGVLEDDLGVRRPGAAVAGTQVGLELNRRLRLATWNLVHILVRYVLLQKMMRLTLRCYSCR